jgi:hypothetical protein
MTSLRFSNFMCFLLAFAAALTASLALQFVIILLLMPLGRFGIDMSTWPIEVQNWIFYSSEAFVAFGGITIAGYVAPPALRVVFCCVITLLCLGLSWYLLHMVGKGHGLPNPGWFYYLGHPILHSFAFGGVAGILYFGWRRGTSLPDLKMRRS